MGLSLEERAMKELIENYKLNEKELERLYQRFIKSCGDVGKVTPTYGLNAGSGGFGFSSKVENVVVNKMSLQEKISILEDEIYRVNISQDRALNALEKEVIEYLKNGLKMSYIARAMKKERKEIKKVRDIAIKKMTFYVDDNT